MSAKTSLIRGLKTVLVVLIVFFLIGGGLTYVEAVIAETLDHNSSSGSPVSVGGRVYGSYLLTEAFNYSIFFHPRPSAIDYKLSSSSGFSWSLDNPVFLNNTRNLTLQFMRDNNLTNMSQVPSTMVLYSDSGLDPNIPLDGAMIQLPRISASLSVFASNLTGFNWTKYLLGIVDANVQQNFPVFGSQYVNVVYLNFDILNELMAKHVISQSYLQ